MILGRLLEAVRYDIRGEQRMLRAGTNVEILSIGTNIVQIDNGGVVTSVRSGGIEILTFRDYYKFTRELCRIAIVELIRDGRFKSVNQFRSNIQSAITLTTESYQQIMRVTNNTISGIDPYYDIAAGKKEEKENTITSNNLKLLFGEGFKPTVSTLLEIFKYIPIKYDGNSGFYDSKNKRLILFSFTRAKSPNPYKPSKIVTYVQFVPIKDEDSSLILQMLDVKSLKGCKFIVRNYIDSGRIFKFTNEKKEVLNKEFEALEISLGVKSKNNEEPVNTIILRLPNGNRRFILSDVEIIYPNISGYNEKKDRVIKPNMNVKVIDDKRTIFKKNDVVKAVGIKNLGNKKFAIFLDKNNNEKLYNTNKFKVI